MAVDYLPFVATHLGGVFLLLYIGYLCGKIDRKSKDDENDS